MKKFALWALPVLLVATLVSCGGGQATPTTPPTPPTPTPAPATPGPENPVATGTVQVSIKNISFDPDNLTVEKGTTVIWTNNDPIPHTVTETGGKFDSGSLKPGATFSYVFKESGNYSLLCGYHPGMQGLITVK